MRIVTVVLIALGLAFAPAHAAERSAERAYHLGVAGEVAVHCDGLFGGVCLDLAGDEVEASIAIDDVQPWEVGARFQFSKLAIEVGAAGTSASSWAPLLEGRLCGAIAGIEVPEGSERLTIYVDGPARAAAGGCPAGAGAFGTSGIISVGFATE